MYNAIYYMNNSQTCLYRRTISAALVYSSTQKKMGATLSTSVWHLVCCIVHFLPKGEIADLLQQLLPCQMIVFDGCVRVKLMN